MMYFVLDLVLEWKPWSAGDRPTDAYHTYQNKALIARVTIGDDVIIGKIWLDLDKCMIRHGDIYVSILDTIKIKKTASFCHFRPPFQPHTLFLICFM